MPSASTCPRCDEIVTKIYDDPTLGPACLSCVAVNHWNHWSYDGLDPELGQPVYDAAKMLREEWGGDDWGVCDGLTDFIHEDARDLCDMLGENVLDDPDASESVRRLTLQLMADCVVVMAWLDASCQDADG